MPIQNSVRPKLKNPYPAIDFERAYKYLLAIREKFPRKNRFGRKELLEEGLGFPEKNGSGHNVVGALGHYDLIRREGSKDQVSYNITPEADRLLRESDVKQWSDFALQAVSSPVLFNFLYSKYPDGNIPVGVDSMLVKRYEEVNEKNVSAIIRRYQASLKFVRSKPSNMNIKKQEEQKETDESLDNKLVEVNMGDGITMTIPERTLAQIVKTHFFKQTS